MPEFCEGPYCPECDCCLVCYGDSCIDADGNCTHMDYNAKEVKEDAEG